MTTLIEATTSAVAASSDTQFSVKSGEPATLSATSLAGAEEVDITYSVDGTTWTTAYNSDTGSPLVLTAIAPQIMLVGRGLYRVAKDATTSASSVSVLK